LLGGGGGGCDGVYEGTGGGSGGANVGIDGISALTMSVLAFHMQYNWFIPRGGGDGGCIGGLGGGGGPVDRAGTGAGGALAGVGGTNGGGTPNLCTESLVESPSSRGAFGGSGGPGCDGRAGVVRWGWGGGGWRA